MNPDSNDPAPRLAHGRIGALKALGLLAILTACGGSGTPPPPPTETLGRMLGQITPWTTGAVSTMQVPDLPVSASVSSAGRFDLSLPLHAAMTTTHASTLIPAQDLFGCTSTETQVFSAPAGMTITPENYLVSGTGDRYIAPVSTTRTTYNFKGWWFSNVDGTLRFKGNCPITGQIDTTLALKRGWNVINTETLSSGGGTTYAVTSQPTAPISWKKAAAAQSLSTQGIHPDILTPWKSLPNYQSR